MSADKEYAKLIKQVSASHDGAAGQMFGKQCIKVGGKAAIALFQDCLVFKLNEPEHALALGLSESVLWDPSGKGRAMKQWVQVTLTHRSRFKKLATAAAEVVASI